MEVTHEGGCLCGAVRFEVTGALNPGEACHCWQCRKQTGHYLVTTEVTPDRFALTGEDQVRWYQSSEKVRRGFCGTCGSVLFWDPIFQPRLGVAMGAFDGPTEVGMKMHIFVSQKGDYFTIGDEGVPQHER